MSSEYAATIPPCLRHIPSPPHQLFHQGASLDELMRRPRVAIVGSRMVTPYGRQVTSQIATKLAEQGIVIVSGLALGVDGIAHRATLEAGGLTIAVLPTPLDKIAPATHHALARQILQQGGALVSEYKSGDVPGKQNFIARNRLVTGLADILLITEAAHKSGSLHTARFALDQGKDVLAVPGAITSLASVGTNNLIKAGATPVTSYRDILDALGIVASTEIQKAARGRNRHEQAVLDLLTQGIDSGDELLEKSLLDASSFNQAVTMLEIGGKIRSLGANHWAIRS